MSFLVRISRCMDFAFFCFVFFFCLPVVSVVTNQVAHVDASGGIWQIQAASQEYLKMGWGVSRSFVTYHMIE